MRAQDAEHVPVLLRQSVELLAPWRGGLFVDATVGLGGHARAVLEAGAARRLAPFQPRFRLVEGDFRDLGRLAAALNLPPAAGILADLGVSSLQLERAERGFSFRLDGPLDMRMGRGQRTAAEIVNRCSEGELADIFREYGEERRARRIARAVAAARREAPLVTTRQLAAVVERAVGGRRPADRLDPATRVFQALRIAVNDELAAVERLLAQAVGLLAADGRLVVISYHSLEDRRVKERLRHLAQGEVDPVTGRPRSETRVIELLTRKPLRPSPEELAANPRSRSARLRAARRL